MPAEVIAIHGFSDTDQITDRASELTNQYSFKLTQLVNETVPNNLSNAEYAARTAALMISLNRELARCAASFGESQNVTPEIMMELVSHQFVNNYGRCLTTIRGEGNG